MQQIQAYCITGHRYFSCGCIIYFLMFMFWQMYLFLKFEQIIIPDLWCIFKAITFAVTPTISYRSNLCSVSLKLIWEFVWFCSPLKSMEMKPLTFILCSYLTKKNTFDMFVSCGMKVVYTCLQYYRLVIMYGAHFGQKRDKAILEF